MRYALMQLIYSKKVKQYKFRYNPVPFTSCYKASQRNSIYDCTLNIYLIELQEIIPENAEYIDSIYIHSDVIYAFTNKFS